ncbi:hypothetical protein COCON_G00075800 [Conger conger]|uniref:Uncharacterized protein n=1 Tax=Conger conger TaxID=82655 RepID=A0A9Q1I241_CONCO|nr:hypothetical protein COCON_G00075800 [Conger conger]
MKTVTNIPSASLFGLLNHSQLHFEVLGADLIRQSNGDVHLKSSKTQMEFLRQYFWLLIVLGIVFVSILIGLLFIWINNCITRTAEQYTINSQRSEFYAESSQYHPKQLEEELPPLPARNPSFRSCSSSASYEDIDNPEYVHVDEKAAPPPYQSRAAPVQEEACRDRDSVSTEAYDDVVPPGYESEDYDDVE